MAIITNSMFGDLSGKVGGTVFSKSAGQQQARAYVVGTDVKSLQQLTARQRFSLLCGKWRTLTMSQKQAWISYGANIFQPKHPKAGVIYSGYQAFMSDNSILQTLNAAYYGAILINPVCVHGFDTFETSLNDPGNKPFSAQICTAGLAALNLSLNDASYVSSSRTVSVVIGFGSSPQASPPAFQTPINGTPVGFACYFSSPFSGGRTTTAAKEPYLVGSIGRLVLVSGWTSSNSVTFSWVVPSVYFDQCKYKFNSGSHIFVTVYAVSLTGQIAYVGRLLILIS